MDTGLEPTKTYIQGRTRVLVALSDICDCSINTVKRTPQKAFDGRSRLQHALHIGLVWYQPQGKLTGIREELEAFFLEGELPDQDVLANRRILTTEADPSRFPFDPD